MSLGGLDQDFKSLLTLFQLDRTVRFSLCLRVLGLLALRQWHAPLFLAQGVPMGAVLSRKMVTNDASLTGVGLSLTSISGMPAAVGLRG